MGRVLFTDLGDVVIRVDRKRRAAALQKFLPAQSVDEIDAILTGEEATELHHRLDCGKMTMNQYQHAIEGLLGATIDSLKFGQAHVSVLNPNILVIDLWKKLLAEGKIEKLIAVTNTDDLRLTKALDLCRLPFGAIIASYAVGARKPNPIMFQIALSHTDAPAQQCIMVDDRLQNIEAAQALGITGIHYRADNPHAHELLINDLQKSGIAI